MSKTLNSTNTFSIFRSSAGSGKTYQLALEFIALVIKDPNLFNKILAVTFTNKATREMKERILQFLFKLAHKEDQELLELISEKTGLPPEKIAENAVLVNEKILHNYSEFSISTIDAFFQKIVKSFAKELGLLGNYKVEFDQDKIMQEIIDQIIAELGQEKDLTNWLVDFSYSKVDEHRAWDIRPEIKSLAGEVFKESFMAVEEQLADNSNQKLHDVLQQVKKSRQKFEQFMTSNAKNGFKLIEKHGLSIQDFAYGFTGPAGYFDRIIKRRDFDPKERVRTALEDPEKWSTKSSQKKDEIQTILDAGLQEITQSLVDYYTTQYTEYITAIEIQKNLYVFGILSRLIEKLEAYRQENDVMLISDVAVFLKEIIADNDTPFIYEKTGSWYRHYLIDEFQDTSGYQWQNFKPLVENGLSEHQKSLLVGDGKQSIYRWRGGDWNLLLNQVEIDLKNYSPTNINLDTNWRSDRKIIEFNNEVFAFLRELIARELHDEINGLDLIEDVKAPLLSMSEDVRNLYQDVVQQVAQKNVDPARGSVELNMYQKSDEESWKEMVLRDLPGKIEELQDNGFQAKDIAILVRKSDDGKRVIEQLLRYKNSPQSKNGYCYDAISNESLFLGNSSAIRLIINTIKYGLNSNDEIAKAELSFINYQLKHYDSGLDDLMFIRNQQVLTEALMLEVNSLISLPVYEMVEKIIQLFELQDHKFKGYLQAFQDLVLEYFSGENKDINDFLEWWEEKGRLKSVQLPEQMNAIRVMTIHKSKGLEFKALIIPFCDWKLDHEGNKNNILWCKTDHEPFAEAGYLPIKYSKSLAESYFARDYYEEKIKAHIDNLNLLYVALTRAENCLIVNCPPPSKEKLSHAGDLMVRSINRIMEQSSYDFEVMVDSDDDQVVKYSIGSEERLETAKESFAGDETKNQYQTSNWRTKIAIRRKGGEYFSQDSVERRAKINYGVLVHEILAACQKEADAEELVIKYFIEGTINAEEKKLITEQLQMIFSNPEVNQWFNTSVGVKTEIPIITSDNQLKRPDRVLIEGKKAVVIDFKTGMEKAVDKKQVLEYRDILLEMGYEKVDSYLLYIARNKVLKVA